METKTIKYLDEMKDLSGVMENYQGNEYFLKRVAFQLASTSFSISLLMYSMSYLTAVPAVSCRQPDNTYLPTNQAEACQKLDQCKFDYGLDNWTKKYDLVCGREYIKDLMLTVMFVSTSLSNLSTAFLIDTLGRKSVIILCTALFFVIGPALYLVESFHVRMILCGVLNSFNSSFTSSNTILVREITPSSSPYNSFVVNYGFVFYSLGSIFIGLITLGIHTHETLWVLIIGIGLIMMAGNFFAYLESPIFLYKAKRESEMLDVIEKYAEINGTKADRLEIIDKIVEEEEKLQGMIEMKRLEQEEEQLYCIEADEIKPRLSVAPQRESLLLVPTQNEGRKSGRLSIGSLLAGEVRMSPYASINLLQKSVIQPTFETTEFITEATFISACFILSLESAAIYFIYYGMAISIDTSGMNNIHTNAVILGISSMLAYHYSSILTAYPRIKTKTFIFGGMLACTGLLVAVGAIFKDSFTSRVVKTLISMGALNVLVCCSFSVFYIYASEALPVTKRGLGIGLSIFSGKLVGSLATYVKSASLKWNLDPVVGCCLPCFLALIAVQLLPESKPRPT